jgi:fermentation-respiration switch protein FrsA (DUF1100 family)
MFFPQPTRGAAHPPRGWTLERVTISAADGTPLAGVLLFPARPASGPDARLPALLYFGGNAEEVTAHAPVVAEIYGQRAVLLVNYRGYGDSGGRPGEKALVADSLAVYDWAARRAELDAGRLCAHGRSLGTGVAVQLAAARPLKCVVLTSPFESLVAVGQSHMPWVPVGLLLRHRFDSLAHAPLQKVPALVLYGGADTIIPGEHSERLAAAWGGPVEKLRLERAGHNDIERDARYGAAIRAFLDRTL